MRWIINYKWVILFWGLFVFSSYRLAAQSDIKLTFTGTVVDSVTKKPLEFCNIIFKNLTDTGKTIGCITNTEGKFKIVVPVTYKYLMQFSIVGYQIWSDTVDLTKPNEDEEWSDFSGIPMKDLKLDMKTIKLSPVKNVLHTVTVTSASKTMDIDKQSIIVTKKMRENTIAAKDVLDKVDGIRYNRVTRDVKVDNDKNVKILVDGVEKDKNFILNLNPKRIKKIEILRNISGIYEIEGYHSIINIITYDNYRGYDVTIDEQFLNNLNGQNKPKYLSNNTNVNLNITRDKWNYYVKTSGYYNDMKLYSRGITEFTTNNDKIINGQNTVPNNFTRSNDYRFRFGADYQITKKQLIGFEAGMKGFPATSQTQNISFDTTIMSNDTSILKNVTNSNSGFYSFSGNVYYRYNIDSTSNLISYFYYQATNTTSKQNINDERNLLYDKSSNNLNGKLQYEKTFKNKFTLTSGGRFLNNDYQSIADDSTQNDFYNNFFKITVFTYLKIKFNKSTSLLAGTSYEYYQSANQDIQSKFNSFQPRITLNKQINKNNKLVLEYRLNTKYPYLSDMNPQITYVTPFIASMGNPELKPYLYHKFSFEYRKLGNKILSYFSIKPYYQFSDNEMGLNPVTHDSLITYRNENFVKHEKYGIYTSLSFDITKKFSLDLDLDIYKDWNKNLNTPNIFDWNGDAQITYTLNTKHYLGLMYQKEYAKTVSSLGYSRDGTDFIMLYWMTLQLKGRLQFMLGYALPVLPTQINEEYEETPYYIKHNYTDVSIIKNMIMVNLVFRLSKGKVQKYKNDIDYENYDHHDKKLNIGL